MGISYSSEPNDLAILPCMELLRETSNFAQSFVNYYVDFVPPPFLRKFQVESMVGVVFKSANKFQTSESQRVSQEAIRKVVDAVWYIFNVEDKYIIVQEFLTCVAVLSSQPWAKRAEWLYFIYKCPSSDSIGYDEITFAAQASAHALCRLWGNHIWSSEVLARQCSSLADGAFTKLGLEFEDDIQQEGFVMWVVGRFKEGKSIVSTAALRAIYESQFDVLDDGPSDFQNVATHEVIAENL